MRQLKITQQITNRDSQSLNKYFTEVSSIKMISIEQEKELAKKASKGDLESINELVKTNLRFAISVAKQYQNTGEPLEDLIAAGNIGLLQAAKRFDESKGFKFISYAVWWIRQSIMQHLNENSKSIRIPLNKLALLNKVRNAQSELEQMHQRTPSQEEIAVYLSEKHGETFTIENINNVMNLYDVNSLDDKLSSDGESSTLHDVTPGSGLEILEMTLKREDLRNRINASLNRLSFREKEVVEMYFGLNENEKSLAEIGEKLELTRERVRQIKETAVRKLRSPRNRSNLNEFL